MQEIPVSLRSGQTVEELVPPGTTIISSDPAVLAVVTGQNLAKSETVRFKGLKPGKATLTVTLTGEVEVLG